MAPAMFQIRVDSAAELFGLFNKFDQDWHFRGQRDTDWGVLTSLERIACTDPYEKEKELLDQFLGEYGIATTYDQARILSLIQHYATDSVNPVIGTRLLDVTQDFNVATYFAVANAASTSSGNAAVFAFNTYNLSKMVVERFKHSNPANLIAWFDAMLADRTASATKADLYRQALGAMGASFFNELIRLPNGHFGDSLLPVANRLVCLIDPTHRLLPAGTVLQSIFNQRLVQQKGAFLVPFGLSKQTTIPRKGDTHLTAFEECLMSFLSGPSGFDRASSVRFFREDKDILNCSKISKSEIDIASIVKIFIPQSIRGDILKNLTGCSAKELRLCSAPSCK